MNIENLFKQFNFNIIKFNKYHLTDNTKTPIQTHYFGCLIKGTAIIKAKDIEINLKPNEVFYIPKGLKYQSQWFSENGKTVEFYSFGFTIAPTDKSYILQKIECSERAKEIFRELCEEIPFSSKGIGKLYYFFGEISDSMIEAKKTNINKTVEKAAEIITENPYIKISEVAKICNVSESGLYILFKKHFDRTPNDLKNKVLCEKAKTLLSTTNNSVQEISDMLGFSSTSYFRKLLKKHIGKAPLEIRKESAF